jgi:hypothetical protein
VYAVSSVGRRSPVTIVHGYPYWVDTGAPASSTAASRQLGRRTAGLDRVTSPLRLPRVPLGFSVRKSLAVAGLSLSVCIHLDVLNNSYDRMYI